MPKVIEIIRDSILSRIQRVSADISEYKMFFSEAGGEDTSRSDKERR